MSDTRIERKIFIDIVEERTRQNAKWGEQNHDPVTWLAILMEEIGEVSKEILVMRFSSDPDKVRVAAENYRDELVQVAAVAVAALECLDRNS